MIWKDGNLDWKDRPWSPWTYCHVMLHSLKIVALPRHRSVGVALVARRVEVRRADRRHLKHGGGAAAGDVDAARGAGLAEIGPPLPGATCGMNLAGSRFSVG